MPVQRLQGVAIHKANLVRGDSNHRAISSVQLKDVVVPAATEISAGDPKLAEGCEEGSRDLTVWMEEDVIGDLR